MWTVINHAAFTGLKMVNGFSSKLKIQKLYSINLQLFDGEKSNKSLTSFKWFLQVYNHRTDNPMCTNSLESVQRLLDWSL